jgi:hypothetical protein
MRASIEANSLKVINGLPGGLDQQQFGTFQQKRFRPAGYDTSLAG